MTITKNTSHDNNTIQAIDLPCSGLSMKGGTDIIAINGIGAELMPDNEYGDGWYVLCKVQWDNGKTSNLTLHPSRICWEGDKGQKNLTTLMAEVSNYIFSKGTWDDTGSVWRFTQK